MGSPVYSAEGKTSAFGRGRGDQGGPGSVGGGVLMNRLGAMLLTTQPYFIHRISKSWLKLCHLVHFVFNQGFNSFQLSHFSFQLQPSITSE